MEAAGGRCLGGVCLGTKLKACGFIWVAPGILGFCLSDDTCIWPAMQIPSMSS